LLALDNKKLRTIMSKQQLFATDELFALQLQQEFDNGNPNDWTPQSPTVALNDVDNFAEWTDNHSLVSSPSPPTPQAPPPQPQPPPSSQPHSSLASVMTKNAPMHNLVLLSNASSVFSNPPPPYNAQQTMPFNVPSTYPPPVPDNYLLSSPAYVPSPSYVQTSHGPWHDHHPRRGKSLQHPAPDKPLSPEAVKRIVVDLKEFIRSDFQTLFAHANDEDIRKIDALIIGPPDTPYSGGFFHFDMQLPSDYPWQPPSVHIITTGNGSVAFSKKQVKER
jgi:hypothetical protein